jgi:Protein of unknown function (DUF2851)
VTLLSVERRGSPSGLPAESELFAVWERQSYPRGSLRTGDGERVRVIYRVRPGAGPGPDFRDALVEFPGGVSQGDVELHVRTSDFRRHGHEGDPAYANVVLHVVFVDDGAGPTPLFGGGRAPVVAVGRAGELAKRAAARLGGRPAGYAEPCRSSVERLGPDAVGASLDRLGGMRFRQKAAAMVKLLAAGDAPEDVLWSGLLEALGYGGERDGLRAVAAALPWRELRMSLLRLPVEERTLEATRILVSAWDLLKVKPGRAAGVRPRNQPEKRLAGAGQLAARFCEEGLAAGLLPLLEEEGAPALVTTSLTVPGLIGRSRAIELAGNVVLPLAAALCGPPSAFRYEALLGRLPLPARYGSVRHLHRTIEGAVAADMRRQQGMLYLLRQYCTQGGCGTCPLS